MVYVVFQIGWMGLHIGVLLVTSWKRDEPTVHSWNITVNKAVELVRNQALDTGIRKHWGYNRYDYNIQYNIIIKNNIYIYTHNRVVEWLWSSGFHPSSEGNVGMIWLICGWLRNPAPKGWLTPYTTGKSRLYPLVNIQKTMEHHHFKWVNLRFQWPFSIAMLNYQRVIYVMFMTEINVQFNYY